MVPGVSIRTALKSGTPGDSTVDPGHVDGACVRVSACMHVSVCVLVNSPATSL